MGLQDIDPDPKKTSFFLAMQQCVGVVLVLDEEATATRRSWCCFEEVVIPAVYFTSTLLSHSLS